MLGWTLLAAELRRWAREDRRPQLWWRDDDARRPTPALNRLLDCAGDRPLALAVVPDGVDLALAGQLRSHPQVSVMQHGVDHRSQSTSGPPSQFSAAEPVSQVAVRLEQGWRQLAAFQERLPVYVPPWNDLTANVQAALPLTSLQFVSAWREPSEPGRQDVHLDLLRWQPRPRFIGETRFLSRLRRALAERRKAGRWDDPIGLLTHHLDHDEAAWRFLRRLLDWRPLSARVWWRSAGELFGLAHETARQRNTGAANP